MGVLEASGTEPNSFVVSAHADRHGVVCTGPGEFQYAAYVAKARGDLDGNSISEQTILNISSRFENRKVEAYDPWHGGYLGQGNVTNCYECPRRGNLFFEIESLPELRVGTPAGYLQHLEVGSDTLAAQLDNVLGVALAVDLFRRGYQGTALFTAEEEAGRSWRYAVEWFRAHDLQTDRLLVLDTSPYPDEESAQAQQVVLRRRDSNGVFSTELVAELEDCCSELGLTSSFKDEQIATQNEHRVAQGLKPASLGRTELGRIVEATNGTVNGATLQFPTTGYHTSRETVHWEAVRAAVAVTDRLLLGA